MNQLHTRRAARDPGFTLIELSVVIVVLGVLVTMMLVTLLGQRDRANDSAAKALATQALKTQKVHFADTQAYTTDTSTLIALEPTLKRPLVLGQVVVKNANGDDVTLVATSESGTCFWMREIDGVTSYAKADDDCVTIPDDSAFSADW